MIAAASLLFFVLEQFAAIRALLDTVAYILRPICYGMVLAFLLLPVHRRVLAVLTERFQGGRDWFGKKQAVLNALSIFVSLAFAFLLLYILLAMVLPQLYWSVVGLFNALPGYFQSVQRWLTDFLADNPDIQQLVLGYYRSAASYVNQWMSSDLIPNLESASSTIAWLRAEILPQLTGVVSGVSTVLMALFALFKDIIVAVIVSVYLLARKDVFAAQAKKIVYSLCPTRAADLLVAETRRAYRIFSGFITGKIIDSAIIGVICFVGMSVLGMPFTLLISVIVGVTNVIPFFGPFIGAIPSVMILLMASPIDAIKFAIFVLALQQFDGNILGPKILGDSTGLSAIWVLVAIIVGGGLFGFAGMVVGVPTFAVLYSLTSDFLADRLKAKGITANGEPLEPEAAASGEETLPENQ